MSLRTSSFFLLPFLLGLFWGCANIIPPTGGKNDTTPPKLLSIKPKDSLLNTRINRIDMRFDEFVTVNDVAKELQISPILSQSPTMSVSGKTVTLKIADSLLQDSTTYTISFGKAIRDLHESNPYNSAHAFIFSTGAWFDSLSMKGNIIDAESGKTDSTGTTKILLYNASDTFDIVTKKKPAYITTTKTDGSFVFKGLPNKIFRIFALKESTESLKFDSDDEFIGFVDATFNPAIDTAAIVISIFKEVPDTSKKKRDTSNFETAKSTKRKTRFSADSKTEAIPSLDSKTFNYAVLVDTTNSSKRTQEITKPIEIYFSRPIDTFNQQKILLSFDSSEIEIESKFVATIDSSRKKISLVQPWKTNTVYTLRLLKGFVRDTSRTEGLASKYIFRSKSEDDYGKMEINIPSQYLKKNYLLNIKLNTELVYLEPILRDKVIVKQLVPGTYTLQIIEDTNGDGEWTTGELKTKRHAEKVIPYFNPINMKAGWEHVIDFELKKESEK